MPAAPATQGRALPDPSRGVLAALAAAACALLLYLPAVHFGFVFDDGSLLTAAGEPVALGGVIPYRPLRYASYLVDWSLGGGAPVYHLHNVLLHALVAGLTALLARRLGARPLAAFFGALVVALHPLAVEAAAYVAGRRDLLCVAFGLGALLAQLGNRTRVALALLFCSVASKESGLVFAAPLAAAIVVATPPTVALARALAATALVTVAAAATSLLYGAVGPWWPGAGADALVASGRVLLHYASGLAGLRVLAPEYPALFAADAMTAARAVACAATALLAAFGLVVAAAACFRARREAAGREGAFVLAWTMATTASLALWAGVHEPGADRHAYLLLPPVGVAVSLLASRLLRARLPIPFVVSRAALGAAAASLAVVAALASREQMKIWKSERALWDHAVAQGSASPRARANLARLVAADGDFAAGRRHLAAALEAGSDDGLVYASRAALRCAEGRRALAQRDVRRAHRAGAASLVEAIVRDCDLSRAAGMRLPRRQTRPLEASDLRTPAGSPDTGEASGK